MNNDEAISCRPVPLLGGSMQASNCSGYRGRENHAPGSLKLWFGLSSAGSTTGFTWIDGTPYDYTAWAPGQPVSQGATCGYMTYIGYFLEEPLKNWSAGDCEGIQAASICKATLQYGPGP